MKRDQADQFERGLSQPLAEVLRTKLGDAAEVHINKRAAPDFWWNGSSTLRGSKSCSKMHEPKSSFGPLAAKPSLRSGNGEGAADSFFPIPQGGGNAGDSARAFIDAVAERICQTASMWNEEPPESFGWSVP